MAQRVIELAKEGAVGGTGEPASDCFQASRLERALLAMNRGLARAIIPAIFRSFFTLNLKNRDILKREVVPGLKERGHLLIANHNSHLDAISIYCSLPYRIRGKLVGAAAADYFFNAKSKMAYYLLQSTMRAVPVRRNASPTDFFRVIGSTLDRGESVLIFPEGTRSRTGELGPFLPSIGQLVREVDAPVVPISLHGTHELWPAHEERPKFGEIGVTINAPIEFSKRRDPYDIRDQLFEFYRAEFMTTRSEPE